MERNSTDINCQLEKSPESIAVENQIDGTASDDSTAISAPKSINDKVKETPTTSPPPAMHSLPKVLYLKKLVHPVVQSPATGSSNSVKEPIPKLIVSTKSIKLASSQPESSQNENASDVRYITLPSEAKPVEIIDPQPVVKPVEAIKSTKIIIKGITSQDKRLMVCESPTTTEQPVVSPQASPTVQSPKIATKRVNEDESVPDVEAPAANEENQPAPPRTIREMKQLQKITNESEFGCDASRRIKRKLNETMDEGEERAATPSDDANVTDEMADVESISIRRNTRSLNAEFSEKQRKFLAGIQKHQRESDGEYSDDERGRGRRKIRKSGKLFPPLKVCVAFNSDLFHRSLRSSLSLSLV